MYSREENQLIQTYISFKFIYELHSLDFVHSNEFKKLPFKDDFVKKITIDNGIMTQGMIPPILYMLLVIPKEMLTNKYKGKYREINENISKMKMECKTNYLSDKNGVDYIRHIRNAVSHMNIEYKDGGVNIFKDSRKTNPINGRKPRREEFFVCINNIELGKIVGLLNEVYIMYIDEIKQKTNKSKQLTK